MQPTVPQTQTTVTADMDLPAVQSMDWLFKKERIYLLAQFWQQRAALAEKEINTLKEQLNGINQTSASPISPTTTSSSSNNDSVTPTTTVTASAILAAVSPTSATNVAATATTIPNKLPLTNNNNSFSNNSNGKTQLKSFSTIQQNGLPSPASTPPSSNCGSTATTPTGTPITNNSKSDTSNCLSAGLVNCVGSSSPTKTTSKLSKNPDTEIEEDVDDDDDDVEKMDDVSNMTSLTTMTADIKLDEQLHNNNNNSNICNNNNSNSSTASTNNLIRSSTPIDKNLISTTAATTTIPTTDCSSNLSNVKTNNSSGNSSNSNVNNNTNSSNASGNNTASSDNNSGKTSMSTNLTKPTTSASTISASTILPSTGTIISSIVDELAAKDKEIKALIDEVTRLTALQESHIVQIQRLEDCLEDKRQHIHRLEVQLHHHDPSETTPLNLIDDSLVKKETSSSIIPPLDISSSVAAAAAAAAAASVATDAKQFQELLLERTKALAAAQNEALKSSSSSDDANGGLGGGVSLAGSLNNCHQDIDKASSHHETTSSTASTPNLQDGRSTGDGEHMNGSCGGGPGSLNSMSLSMGMKNPGEDNNNSLGPLPHVPAGFLPGLPFQFQERGGHFRFAEDLQLPPGSMAGRLGDSLIPKSDPMEAKLQEMLRYNMDKYANQNLDTLHISRRIRELLSVHNIGQRIFAKYVLGLSQGTVSELLSKPKPWDKLTEKGRDSYRKMHAWGCDDNAVLLLKSLIPKKDSGMPQYGRPDDGMSDDRIAHILTEASNLMKTPPGPPHLQQQQLQQQQHAAQQFQQAAAVAAAAAAQQHHHQQQQQQQPHQQQQQQQPQNLRHQSSSVGPDDSHSHDDSKSPTPNRSTSPFYKESRRMRKFDSTDDISQDKVARIYQEELAKLMTRGPRDAFQSFLFPHFFSGGMPPVSAASQPMPDENIRMALEAYHRELAKLQQTGGAIPNFPNLPGLLALQQQALNGAQDLSCKKDNKAIKVNGQQTAYPMDTNDQNTKDLTTANDEAMRHSSAFSLVRPKQEPGTPAPPSAGTTTSSTAPSPLSNSILPPAMTPNDDFSSSASPLQRMASITNSLITQPPVTPHHSNQQRPMKAVLPPITQQQFDMFNNLNTEDIVRRVKEALSQYSISQRLFGESVLGLSQGSVSDLLARPKPWHMLTQKGREPFIRMKMFLEDDNAVHKLVASQYKIAPEKLMRTGNYSGSPQIPPGLVPKMGVPMQKMMNDMKMPDGPQHLMQLQATAMGHIPVSQHQGMLLTPPGLPPHHAISLPSHNDHKNKPMMMPSVHSPQQQQNNAMRTMHQHMSPTVYEMAALTHDLDTQVITTKIKEALLANNIGQKIFGEAVLGLSQGSVSELLSKPKPWHMLSIKGREPFIRMQLWLSDANNVERLQALKIERREASKRRRSSGPGNQDNSSDTSSNDTADFYTSSPGPGSVGSSGVPPNKKQRVLFSEEQKEALRLAFALDPYPNVATIEFLANELVLATRTITNWFHNHRMRLKQQVPHGTPAEAVPSRENQSATPFDPVQFRILLSQRLMELQKERMGLSGVPIPYPPYFTANPNLAALIGRGLLPGNEQSLAALNNAFKEQMSGLDLTMNALKRERSDDYDDDGEEESHLSDNESLDGSDIKSDHKETPSSSRLSGSSAMASRTSRRKPVAPQWVNPDWQDGTGPPPPGPITEPEVIINGVCVMQNQAADYSRKEETVRVEPIDVQDNHNRSFDDDAEEDCGSEVAGNDNEDGDNDDGRRSQMSEKHSDEAEAEAELEDAVPNNETPENNDDCEEDEVQATNKARSQKDGGENKADEDEDEEADSNWNY